jgi:hypothetical protein
MKRLADEIIKPRGSSAFPINILATKLDLENLLVKGKQKLFQIF